MSDDDLTTKKTVAKKKNTRKKAATKKAPAAKKVVKKAVTKKAAAKKTAAKKAASKKKVSTATSPESSKNIAKVTHEERYMMIQEAAYYRAEKRSFEPGWESQDWTDSEKEIDAMLKKQGKA